MRITYFIWVLRWLSGKEFACQCRRCKTRGFDPLVGKIPWSRKWWHTPAFLPGKCHGQRNMAGYHLWGHEMSTAQHIYLIRINIIESKFTMFIHMPFVPHRLTVMVVLSTCWPTGTEETAGCSGLFQHCQSTQCLGEHQSSRGLLQPWHILWVRATSQCSPAECHCSKESSGRFLEHILLSKMSPNL